MTSVTPQSLLLSLGFLLGTAYGQPMIWIDTHSHLEAGPRIGVGDPRGAARAALAIMDRLGIQKSLIMPPPAPREQPGNDHEELATIARENRERFAFLSGGRSLNPMIQAAVRLGRVTVEFRRRFEEKAEEIVRAGAVGFGEMTALHLSFLQGHPFEEAPPDHPLFLLLAEIAARRNVVIDLHMEAVVQDTALPSGFSSPPNPKILRENIAAFERLLLHNRGARIVWAHVGWDNTGHMTVSLLRRLLEAHPNLYMSIKIDHVTPGRSPLQNSPLDGRGTIRPEWLELIRSLPDRFVIGTDAFYGLPRQPEMISQGPIALLAQLPPDLARMLGYENAARIYRLER